MRRARPDWPGARCGPSLIARLRLIARDCRSAAGTSARMRAGARLQGPDIGGDRPAVGWRHPRRIGIHDPVAVGDDVVEMLHRRLPQAVDVIGRRRREAALDDHAVAVAGAAVARRAIDVEALLPAFEQGQGDRRRRDRPIVAGDRCAAAAMPASSPRRRRAARNGSRFGWLAMLSQATTAAHRPATAINGRSLTPHFGRRWAYPRRHLLHALGAVALEDAAHMARFETRVAARRRTARSGRPRRARNRARQISGGRAAAAGSPAETQKSRRQARTARSFRRSKTIKAGQLL